MKEMETLMETLKKENADAVNKHSAIVEELGVAKSSRKVYNYSYGYTEKECRDIYPKRLRCTCCNEEIIIEPNGDYYNFINCKNCGSPFTLFVTKKVAEQLKDYKAKNDSDSFCYNIHFQAVSKKTFSELVCTANDKGGVSFYRVETIATLDSAEKSLSFKNAIRYSMDYIPGEPGVAVKHLQRGGQTKPVDVFEALNINAQNARYGFNYRFLGADSLQEFIVKNPLIARNTGITAAMANVVPNEYFNNSQSLFLMMVVLYSEFPQMEQLVKMGYYRLFNEALAYIQRASNRQALVENFKILTKLFNPEATKGNEALRMPWFVGQYLIGKAASIDEFLTWCDICELSNMSKEQFEKLLASYEFGCVQLTGGVRHLPEILKYGYSLDKLCRYILKASDMDHSPINVVLHLLKDYRNMCSIAGVEADEYPSELRKRHDDMVKFMREQKDAGRNELLASFGERVDAVVNKKKEEETAGSEDETDKYIVVIPKSMKDFQEEANMQNNCVGHYYHNVLRGESVVFFVRKKESPDESFITAEYNRRLGYVSQFFYKNNRPVSDSKLVAFGNGIGRKIKKGIEMGKI